MHEVVGSLLDALAGVSLVVNQVEEALFAIYNGILSVYVPLLRLILVSRFMDKK
jgi:hypothetical protein